MHGEKKDVSRFRAFGCRAWVHLNSERREKGKHTPRAIEAIHLGSEPNTSVNSFFIPERNTMMSSNQAHFDETVFPFRNKEWLKNTSRTKQLIFYFKQNQMSNGSSIIRCTSATIQGFILTLQVIWWWCVSIRRLIQLHESLKSDNAQKHSPEAIWAYT